MSRWLAAVIFEWLLILLSFAAVTKSYWFLPLGLFVIGTRQHALGILGHEAAHRKGKWSDFLACLLCFWPLGVGIVGYREFHFAHHKYLGSPSLDPEEVYRRKYAPWLWKAPCSRKKRVLLFIADLLGLGLFETVIAFMMIPHRKYDWVGVVFVIGSAIAFYNYWTLGIMWHWALYTVFWATFRCRAWTEHVGSDTGTHKTVGPQWWQRWYLPHGTWKHSEHHLKPNKPQCELKVV